MSGNARDSREEYRSFTLRIPMSLYIQLADLAQADGVPINTKATELIRLGMGEHVNLNNAVARLLRRVSLEEDSNEPA